MVRSLQFSYHRRNCSIYFRSQLTWLCKHYHFSPGRSKLIWINTNIPREHPDMKCSLRPYWYWNTEFDSFAFRPSDLTFPLSVSLELYSTHYSFFLSILFSTPLNGLYKRLVDLDFCFVLSSALNNFPLPRPYPYPLKTDSILSFTIEPIYSLPWGFAFSTQLKLVTFNPCIVTEIPAVMQLAFILLGRH